MHPGRRVVKIVALALVVGGCAAAVPGSPVLTAATPSNQRAAERDIRRVLNLVLLPASARVVGAEPSGDGGLLRGPPQTLATPNLVLRHRFWRVSMPFTAVMSFVRSHVPYGARPFGSGTSGGPRVPPNGVLVFALPATRELSRREIDINIVALSAHVTGVRVDALAVWLIARTRRQDVPPGVHAIQISSRDPAEPRLAPQEVTGSKVARIVGWINALEVVQPGAIACPSEGPAPLPAVSLSFLAAPRGRVLARALVPAIAGDPGPCEPVSLRIADRGTVGLESDHFLGQVERLLRIRLMPGHPRPG